MATNVSCSAIDPWSMNVRDGESSLATIVGVFGTLKVFCIGFNKTGTTSIEAFLSDLGHSLGDQRTGELLLDDVNEGRMDGLQDLARTADAFQDVPFSCPGVFRHLARFFPDAKFILTVRDSPDQWYKSLTRYHATLLGIDTTPTGAQLKEALYCSPGWLLRAVTTICGTTADDPYNYRRAAASYLRHIDATRDYFRGSPDRLVQVNVRDTDSARRIVEFLGLEYTGQTMPHLNVSA